MQMDLNTSQLSKIMDLLNSKELRVINLGLGVFAETYQRFGMATIHVDWHPPAGGDSDLAALLDDLNDLL